MIIKATCISQDTGSLLWVFDMKRIAIIAPCILPVPATKGGSVEGLITKLLNDNEKNKSFSIDLFTIEDAGYTEYNYSCTNILNIKNDFVQELPNRLLDKYYRSIPGSSSKRLIDRQIIAAFVRRLKEIDGKYDAVIIENMMSTAVGVIMNCAGAYDFPVYFHMHNDVDTYRSPEYIKELVRHGVQFIAVSEYIKSRILKCDKNAVVAVLYNGVDLTKFDKADTKSENASIFLFAGRIIPDKGVKELVLSFIKLCDRLESEKSKNTKLVLVGFSGSAGRYEEEIKDIAKSHKNIICKGQVPADEMSVLYEDADIVVMPTISEEPFGLVALEAMAKGKTLITTNSGALPEVVEAGAVVVDKNGDFVENLSGAMYKMLTDDNFRQEVAERGYQRAHEISDFDINNYYKNFEKILSPQINDDEAIISVIVPVYNVSAYLKRSLSSIIYQTYKNLEIILVDDGSTDGSGTICDEYAAIDDRIKVIHQENLGLSGARNTGLDHASGRYIFFCDSDDYLREDALEIMISKMLNDHADVVACGIAKVHDNTTDSAEKEDIFTVIKPGRWSGHESVIQMMITNNVCTVAWNKLYKKELFDGIRFPIGVKNEDEATIYKVLYRAGIVSFIPDTLYKYYQRDDSIIHEDIKDRYRFYLDAVKDRISFFEEKGESDLVQHSRIAYLDWIKHSYRNIDDNDIRKELKELYDSSLNLANAPSVMGGGKRAALLLWKYIRY